VCQVDGGRACKVIGRREEERRCGLSPGLSPFSSALACDSRKRDKWAQVRP